MPTTDSLDFEMQRRVVLYKSGTVMPDDSLLGFNGDPNSISSPNDAGEGLIYNSAVGTLYVDDSGVMYRKTDTNNTWSALGAGSGTGYADTDVDTHLNQSTAGNNQILSWDGSDYSWVTISGDSSVSYGDGDVNTHLNQSTATNNQILSWNGTDYAWVDSPSGSGYTNTDVDAHVNQSTANAGQILSWDGSDYSWVDASTTSTNSDMVSADGSSVSISNSAVMIKTDNTNRWEVSTGGHLLPTTNADYDIGSAERKVRHLFLSDNSLKFVDSSNTEYPLSVSDGVLLFNGEVVGSGSSGSGSSSSGSYDPTFTPVNAVAADDNQDTLNVFDCDLSVTNKFELIYRADYQGRAKIAFTNVEYDKWYDVQFFIGNETNIHNNTNLGYTFDGNNNITTKTAEVTIPGTTSSSFGLLNEARSIIIKTRFKITQQAMYLTHDGSDPATQVYNYNTSQLETDPDVIYTDDDGNKWKQSGMDDVGSGWPYQAYTDAAHTQWVETNIYVYVEANNTISWEDLIPNVILPAEGPNHSSVVVTETDANGFVTAFKVTGTITGSIYENYEFLDVGTDWIGQSMANEV